MATTMFAGFTSSDRRKKVVYGKSSRLSAISPPAPAPASSEDAPPSPERPRKTAAAPNKTLKKAGGVIKAGNTLGNARAKSDDVDMFDVPSEDEFSTRPTKPTKKLQTKRRIPNEGFQIPAAEDEAPREAQKPVEATRPLRKPEPAKPAAAAKKVQKPVQVSKPVQVPTPDSSSDPIAPRTLRGKTPQTTQVAKQHTKDCRLVRQPTAKAKAPSRATTPAPAAPKAQKPAKTSSVLPTKKVPAKPTVKPAEDLGVFDVPSSDEEAPVTVKKATRQLPGRKTTEVVKQPKANADDVRKDSAESDDSNASKKRKRQGSVSSTAAAVRPTLEQKRDTSAPQRSRKYQKQDDSVSPGHGLSDRTTAGPAQQAQSAIPAINKPRRTRLRTVPVLALPTITKGQSSPATLNGMVASRKPAPPSPVAEVPEVTELEDQTMYDIPDPLATPVRPSKAAMPGSATPRQRNLFGGLIGDASSSKKTMPSIDALQLTDRKPKPLIGSLARSKSDVTYSAQARKTRLIDTLKPVQSSSDDEDEDESSTSEELEARITSAHPPRKPSEQPGDRSRQLEPSSDDMDIDAQAADSQTSQVTSGFGVRPRLTYAMSRSYLKEANPEDDLLISMDLSENLVPLPQRHESMSESEPDPTNQARAYHELKSRGRNYAFEKEIESLLDDISSTTANSIRRSTMMELCTKMADKTFTNQLLDSPLAHQFFHNIAAGGDVIFDFATAVATIFVLQTEPTYTVLDQMQEVHVLSALVKLAGNDTDMQKIAKDRKTNLSRIAKDAVLTFSTLVQQSSIWSSEKPNKVSPQLVAMKAIESLVTSLRRAGNTESLLDQAMISQLVEIASKASERLMSDKARPEDELILNMVLSTLESVSATRQKQPMWPVAVLQNIAKFMPMFFRPEAASSTMLAVKLCMNLTNNKPKACQPFATKTFVQPLVSSITQRFQSLNTGLAQDERTEVLESLILSLGAAINLAEFSDQMRLNVDNGERMIATLVELFLEGSERASQVRTHSIVSDYAKLTSHQAESVEESHSGVAIGYLAVLLGNLCLNKSIRSEVRTLLPDQQLDTLVDSIKDFVRVHQHVDSKTEDYEGAEGQEALQTYTGRLLLVVERLENARA
jgi:hypothetical protein